MRARLTVMALASVVAGACHRAPRADSAELTLAAAASESVTVALADSLAPGRGFVVSQSGSALGSLSACDDHGDSHGWQSFGSPVIELELPEGFNSSNSPAAKTARWTGPSGWVNVAAQWGGTHVGETGSVTSECDVFISGWPAHVVLTSTPYTHGIHAVIKPNDAPAIGIYAESKTIDGQAQLLHAIRTARVSSAWGH